MVATLLGMKVYRRELMSLRLHCDVCVCVCVCVSFARVSQVAKGATTKEGLILTPY